LRRWRGALVLSAGLLALLALSPAAGETFVFSDPERPQQSGRVLVEFPDSLFVALDGEPPRFLRRAELAAVIDENGRRYEEPPLGTFAAVGKGIPAAAVTDVSGVAFARRGAESKEEPLPELSKGALFFPSQAGLRTGDNGTLRAVFPSGAAFWLGVDTQVELAQGQEGLRVERGEATLETRLRAVRLDLPRPLAAQVDEGARVVVIASEEATRLEQHAGQSQLAWPSLSLVLSHGHSLEVRELGLGRWRLRADEANSDDIPLIAKGKPEVLPPGEEWELDSELPPEGEVWRVLSVRGDLLLRRGPNGTFVSVPPLHGAEVVVGSGDALRTAAAGEALLGRVDGARFTLRQAAHLEIDDALGLVRGEGMLEPGESPVPLRTPGGRASISNAVIGLSRQGEGLGAPLAVAALAGSPELPCGDAAELVIAQRSSSVISREAPAPDAAPKREPPAGEPVEEPVEEPPAREPSPTIAVRQTRGTALLRSRALPELGDAKFRVALREGDRVQALPPSEAAPHGSLALAGRRLLRFVQPGTEVDVAGTDGQLRFDERAPVNMAEGLTLTLARTRQLPLLRFKSGEELTLRAGLPLTVYNPTVELTKGDTKVELTGEIKTILERAGEHGVGAFSTRQDDHLEVRAKGDARLSQTGEQTRIDYEDGRSLWIEPKAPPVEARFGNAQGALFLSMPGAPSLGLPSNSSLTVLATNDGEFVILDRNSLDPQNVGSELLSEDESAGPALLDPDELGILLDVPQPDSPSGP